MPDLERRLVWNERGYDEEGLLQAIDGDLALVQFPNRPPVMSSAGGTNYTRIPAWEWVPAIFVYPKEIQR